MLRSLTLERPEFRAPARRRWYLGAFFVLAGLVFLIALTSPQGPAELAVFFTVSQLAALTAGLSVYARVVESQAVAVPEREVVERPRVGREALRESLSDLFRQAEKASQDLDVALMLIEPDQAELGTRRTTHAFDRVKLALKSRAGVAEVVELSESCVALTLAAPDASYALEVTAQALLRDLRDFKQNEFGLAPLNLTFGIGVCQGERRSVDGLVWQAGVALRRAYDLQTGIYVVSNRSNLAKRV